MPKPTSFPNLHDWTLTSISLDWKTSTSTFEIEGWQTKGKIVALKTTELLIPHAAPWGPSVSIMDLEGPDRQEAGDFSLTIRMQTGDVICVRAAAIEWH